MKIFLKWLALSLVDWALLLSVPLVVPILSIFTKEDLVSREEYSWGGLYGTYDNPPQGDRGFIAKHSLFRGHTTGFRGYINRIHWAIRNPLYGFAKKSGIPWKDRYTVTITGNKDISDKYKIPGWMYAEVRDGKELLGFELYVVAPYSKHRCVRLRLGWKIKTSKFQEYGFAQLVNTFNPFDGYGKKGE